MTVTRDLGTTATLRELAQHRWDVAALNERPVNARRVDGVEANATARGTVDGHREGDSLGDERLALLPGHPFAPPAV